MYKVINGKKYNTDTAKLLGTWHAEYGLNDFNYYGESLYGSKSGKTLKAIIDEMVGI